MLMKRVMAKNVFVAKAAIFGAVSVFKRDWGGSPEEKN